MPKWKTDPNQMEQLKEEQVISQWRINGFD